VLSDCTLPPAEGGKPGHAVIFLHGVGDSANGGLLAIGEMWQGLMPDCEFLCPDAPFPFDTAPPNFPNRQWFSLEHFTADAILTGVKQAAPYLNAYIDHVLASRHLTADKLTLVGFSQGTIMALYVAPRREIPVACIVGYSGLMAGGEMLHAEKKSSPPVLLVHGKMDDVIPFSAMAEAAHWLKEASIPVTTVACPTAAHTIDQTGLTEGVKFIKAMLDAAGAP
jgi:phospholipase/carboxylesterase